MTPKQIQKALRKERISYAAVARKHRCSLSVVSRTIRGLSKSQPVLDTAIALLQERTK